MVQEIKDKANKAYETGKKMEKHLEEIFTATSLTAVTGFAGYQSFVHRQDSWEYLALGVASAYLATVAFAAWFKALNK